MMPAMSLATRCTACGTIFRVVQDQLRVSEGWVRCGRCAEVFDANEQLFDIDREAPPPWPPQSAAAAPEVPPAPRPAPTPAYPANPAVSPASDESTWVMSPSAHEAEEPFAAPPIAASREPAPVAPPAPPFSAPSRHDEREDLDDHEPTIQLPPIYADGAPPADGDGPERMEPYWSAEPEAPATSAIEDAARGKRKKAKPSAPEPDRAAAPAEAESLDSSSAAAALAAGAAAAGKPMPQPSFLRAAERQRAAATRWQRPGVRVALALASLLLLLTLAAQALWQFRNALLAVHPPSAPLLRSFCDLAGCSLEPWKRIDALAVETSSLTQAGSGNNYKLGIQLQNKAGYALALPWVDLSLTDASGALVARRMLKPADFNLSKTSIAAQSEESLQLVFSTDKLKVSGYSVVIFHP